MNSHKLKSMIGFCRKSGNLKSGTENVLKSIVSGKAKLILVATDASENSIKKVTDKAKYYEVDYYSVLTIDELSKAIGQNNRVSIAITDKKFASSIYKIINEHEEVPINDES